MAQHLRNNPDVKFLFQDFLPPGHHSAPKVEPRRQPRYSVSTANIFIAHAESGLL